MLRPLLLLPAAALLLTGTAFAQTTPAPGATASPPLMTAPRPDDQPTTGAITSPTGIGGAAPSLEVQNPAPPVGSGQASPPVAALPPAALNPDQARAFYQARGFTPEQAEDYASSCVFMTVVRNIGTLPIEHRLADWRYVAGDGKARALRSKAEWDATWVDRGVSEPARIAFAWAQFPATQTFHAGDWNQGMTTYQLPRGSRFNLIVNWRAGGAGRKTTLENVRCTDEIQ